MTIQGWSGGYVALKTSGGSGKPVVIRASSSTDGIHWSSTTKLDTGFDDGVEIRSIVEGPTGLLVQAFRYAGACGGPPALFALWTSTDGHSWRRVAMPKGFTSGRVLTIAGGPAGFIALGERSDGVTQAIWTSHDGHTWTSRRLPTVSTGTLALDGVASFDDGFVLVGSVLGEEGCGGPEHIKYATWFSVDGTGWARATLPDAASDPHAVLQIRRIGRHLLVIQPPLDEGPARGWTSTDGRAWTSIGDVADETSWASVSDGRHAVAVLTADSGVGPALVRAAGADWSFTTISQSGDVPSTDLASGGFQVALGPTGILLVHYADASVYLGVPS